MRNQTILLRFADLKARGIVRNRTTLSRWIKKLEFPPGTLLGVHSRVWTEAEIERWIQKRGVNVYVPAIVLLVVTYGLMFGRAVA